MRVLVTNDDGVAAPGLAHLGRALLDAGHDVLVAAPLQEASGAGAGVGPLHTMGDGIHVDRMEQAGLEGIETLGVDALPGLIVIAGCLGAFGPPPDLVVAGINPGRNVGRAVLHSGTVGAALTAVHFNRRALAVSIQSGPFSGFESSGSGEIHFSTASAIAAGIAPLVVAAPPRTVVNCNVPNLRLSELRGIRWARLARSGLIRSALVDAAAGTNMQLELGLGEPPPGDESDEALTALGYATVTPLASVSEDVRPEVRDTIGRILTFAVEELGLDSDTAEDVAAGPAA